MTVFPERGFHRTTVDQVAAAAGLSTGAVYSNFTGKAELFLALYERQMDRWVREIPTASEDGNSVEARVAAAGDYWASFLEQERDWFLLHMEFWSFVMREPGLQVRYAEQFRRLRLAIVALLEQAEDDFGVELPLPAADLATALQGLNRGLLIETLADPEMVNREIFTKALTAISGLSRPPGPVASDESGGGA